MPRSRHDKEKEQQRFYLLPGMGGRLYRRKQRFIIKWSLAAALMVAAILAAVMYWLDRPNGGFPR